jgi:ectoine hydroxylase-related dioxygenase (phytanoyl-CoA dioxygenase family)
MTTAMARYGIFEANDAADEVGYAAESIERDGCVILQNVFSPGEVADFRAALDALQEAANERGGGRERLAQVNEADIVRAPLAFDRRFLDVATHPRVLAVLTAALGRYFIISQQNGVINPPVGEHNHQSAFHRDLPYQHFTSSRPLAMNVLLCIDPFDATTGGTFFLPGSHQHEAFPSDEYARRSERQIEAAPGCALIMNSMLYHRAGTNRSPRPRRGINTLYSLPFIKQQIVLPRLLDGRYADDPSLGRLLGYESDSPGSVDDYIASRFERLGR